MLEAVGEAMPGPGSPCAHVVVTASMLEAVGERQLRTKIVALNVVVTASMLKVVGEVYAAHPAHPLYGRNRFDA